MDLNNLTYQRRVPPFPLPYEDRSEIERKMRQIQIFNSKPESSTGEENDIISKSSAAMPDPAVVVECMRSGMDVHLLLHTMVSRGSVEATAALLYWPGPIDFRVANKDGCTVLHIVCSVSPLLSVAPLLQCIKNRIYCTKLPCTIEWGQQNNLGLDTVNVAATHGRLSVYWEVFGTIPYYMAQDTISITVPVRGDDWGKIAETERKRFRLLIPIILGENLLGMKQSKK